MGKLVEVTIAADAQYDPVMVFRGDRVGYIATMDTVLCVEDPTIYGGTRFEIPAGQRLILVVQSFATAPATGFSCTALVGSLNANCADLVGENGVTAVNVTAGGVVHPPDGPD